jgi:hypothetical protein
MKEKFKIFFSDLWTALRWGIILSIVIVSALWVSSRLQIFEGMPSSESLVITFIGILATFVVVSNFSQVANIEQKADSKIKEIEDKVKVISKQCLDENESTSLASSIAQVQKSINVIKGTDELKSLEKIKNEAKQEMQGELQSDMERNKRNSVEEIDLRSFQMLKFATVLINSKQKDILQKLLLDTNTLFKVTYTKNGKNKTNKARIQLKDETIQFISETGKTTYDNVIRIDGIPYNSDEIDMALIFVLKAIKKTGIYDRTNLSGKVLEDDQI